MSTLTTGSRIAPTRTIVTSPVRAPSNLLAGTFLAVSDSFALTLALAAAYRGWLCINPEIPPFHPFLLQVPDCTEFVSSGRYPCLGLTAIEHTVVLGPTIEVLQHVICGKAMEWQDVRDDAVPVAAIILGHAACAARSVQERL